MKLIADSGSTKTLWCLTANGECLVQVHTEGINPYHTSEERIVGIITRQLAPELPDEPVSEVFFYGAGCNDARRNAPIVKALQDVTKAHRIEIASDMLGAARSLCQAKAGIACILGTGANSCLYEQGEIVCNISPLGYILGDEGSGAVLGRTLVADYLKHQLPEDLNDAFRAAYTLDAMQVIDAVYRQPMPNRYLASFCPFLSQHRDHAYVWHLIHSEFSRFVGRNLSNYDRKDLPVHFTGSIAYSFSKILRQVLIEQGYTPGGITQQPMEGLIEYHR